MTGGAGMSRPLSVGRVAGIPIFIDASWFVVLALMTWTLGTRLFPAQLPTLAPWACWAMGLAASLLLFACVLAHEMSHALTARMLGTPVHSITLFIFGGVARLARESRRPVVELLVALAGPLASGALAAGCWRLAAALEMRLSLSPAAPWLLISLVIVRHLAMINIAIIVFNLLPGFPLDGGRVLRALLWAILKDWSKATKIASGLGALLAILLVGLGLFRVIRGAGLDGLWYVMLGAFLWNAARASFEEAKWRQQMERHAA